MAPPALRAASRAAIDASDRTFRIDGTTPTYYLYNGLGSTAGLATETGALVGGYRYKYDAFGIRRGPEPTTANAFRFTGELR